MNNTKFLLKGPNSNDWSNDAFFLAMSLAISVLKDVLIKYRTGLNGAWMLSYQPLLCG